MPGRLSSAALDVLKQALEDGVSSEDIGKRLNISKRTVDRIRISYDLFGEAYSPASDVAKAGRPRLLTPEQEIAVLEYLDDNPTAAHEEIVQYVQERFEIVVSTATIFHVLKRHSWSRKDALAIHPGLRVQRLHHRSKDLHSRVRRSKAEIQAEEYAKSIPPDLSRYPKIDYVQAGHLRHFHNLAFQPDNEWRHMGTQEPMQEFHDAYRYQLATMAYAAGVAHFNRQPLLRGVYKPLIRQLIHKMLLRSVWGYWFTTSLGGITSNPDLKELRTPWADPVVRENIMYSGHLLHMTSLYGMLFADTEFEGRGAMMFDWDPMFYGLRREVSFYDNAKLQGIILREMEANGWIGVCSEPNVVYVAYNQFPFIAMRYRDALNGTDIVADTLTKYEAAWAAKKGIIQDNGLMPDMLLLQQDHVVQASDVGWTAWAAAFMNTWNAPAIHAAFDQQALGYITSIDGQVRLHPPMLGNAIRKLVSEDNLDPTSPETLEAARNSLPAHANAWRSKVPYTKPIFGYVVQWLSELGKWDLLSGLLAYADSNLNPRWEQGGLYYERNDEPFSLPNYSWTHMDPFTGNAAIGYARLNVKDGQKTMWERPWRAETVKKRPYVDGITLADGVDFLRGYYDEGKEMAILTMRTWDGKRRIVKPVFKNMTRRGKWTLWVGNVKRDPVKAQEGAKSTDGGEIEVEVEVGPEEIDIVLIKMEAKQAASRARSQMARNLKRLAELRTPVHATVDDDMVGRDEQFDNSGGSAAVEQS
ncbi:Hypothetical protein R9X50_00151700 [Acrodontium crateriforme]|uniref:Linalool dehydratase/isomerase domain-containing protein n=1 Tax=Acrodontium crateriforme TaxID=150365 RepID=A0AAQ3R5W3_9PEZI|nr:Hypothetical protein R9X50_00151700 [Acrodontium crateriforme]